MHLDADNRLQNRGLGARAESGVSLLLMIVIIAIVGIFAVVLLRALLKEIDVEVAREEAATLKTLHQTLQSAIVRDGYIPDHGDWVQVVAANTGMSTNDVATNKRRRNRILLIDPTSTITLPYTQYNTGTLIQPANVRMMLVSSTGDSLSLTGGVTLSAASFTNLWNAVEGTTNFPSWAGRSDDVKIQRLDLTPSFIKVYLTTQPSPPEGRFAVGTNTTPSVAVADPTPVARYFLLGTAIRLYNANGTLDSTQVLNRRASFKYENGIWKGDPSGAVMPGGIDLAAVVRAFLDSTPNMRARYGADQQRLVVLAIMEYLRNYNTWAGGNFTDVNLKNYLINFVQPGMRTNIQGLFLKEGSLDFYPQNTSTCP
jgi:type II secretory pathway pseudopilin PulG